jgi:hypothetical protein
VNLAIRRFKEEQSGKGMFSRSSRLGYFEIVKNFVASGNRVNEFDIERVEKSRYAFPLSVQEQIRGETTMGWTGFAARMTDGKYFGFGTTYHWEFFDFPDGYSGENAVEIVNHSYVLQSGELRRHKVPFLETPVDYKSAVIYREKPFFECFTESI